jgi:amino acid transporter
MKRHFSLALPRRDSDRRIVPEPPRPVVAARRLTVAPLVAATYFMVAGGPYGLEELVAGAGYGMAVVILLATPIAWSVPVALMVGELASAIPEEGGFYVWVRRALGPFAGFMEAWLSLVASVFDMAIYPTLFVLYLSRLWPALQGGIAATALGVGMIGVCTAWNLRGARAVGGGSVIMAALLLAPFAVLSILAVATHLGGSAATAAASAAAAATTAATAAAAPAAASPGATAGSGGLIAGLLVAMWNYMGWDNASTIAGEVERPQRTYPVAMMAAVALVAVTYVLPVAAVGGTGLDPRAWHTGSWVDAATAIGGRWLGVAVVAGGVLCAAGMFNALVLSYSRLPLALAADGFLPRWLSRRDARTGVPAAAVVACAAAYALALGLGFVRLVELDVMLYGLSLILEFVALVVLRVREPHLPRPFRVPAGLPGVIALGLPPSALLLFAFFRGGAPGETIGALSPIALGGLLILAGVAVYALSAPRRRAARSAGRDRDGQMPNG